MAQWPRRSGRMWSRCRSWWQALRRRMLSTCRRRSSNRLEIWCRSAAVQEPRLPHTHTQWKFMLYFPCHITTVLLCSHIHTRVFVLLSHLTFFISNFCVGLNWLDQPSKWTLNLCSFFLLHFLQSFQCTSIVAYHDISPSRVWPQQTSAPVASDRPWTILSSASSDKAWRRPTIFAQRWQWRSLLAGECGDYSVCKMK